MDLVTQSFARRMNMKLSNRAAMIMAGMLWCGLAAAAEPKAAGGIFWPTDSGYVNVKLFGAAGDGKTDDTAAIKKAYAEKNHAMYFPPGTYLVSDTITATPKRYFIQGAGSGRTVIRLKDNCPGFADPGCPKAVLQNWDQPIGKGNNGQGFRNSYHDLTVDIGAGNRGAIGILYFTDNQGTIENVLIRSSDPGKAGYAGIALAQNWPGPALLRHVRVDGCDYGIWSIIGQYSFTFEHMTLGNQLKAGIFNQGQKLFIRGLTSRGKAPAIEAPSGTIVIVDSDLSGGGPAAIIARGQLFARNIKTKGYATAIKGAKEGDVAGPFVEEYPSQVTTLFDTAKKSLNLPVEESPTADWSKPGDWVSAAKFGAVSGGGDATGGIQKAIDSGARVVYLPHGSYTISGTIHVRGNVERIHCMESNLKVGKGDAPVFRIEDGNSPFVIIEQFEGSYGDQRLCFEHASPRALVLKTMIPRGGFYNTTVRGAKLFLDDVCAAPCDFGNSIVYARQLNPENVGTHVSCDGGLFWVLGLKTEKAGRIVEVTNGGKAEVLGGYIYRNRGKDMPDGTKPNAFVNVESSMSVCGIAGDSSVDETRGGQTKTGSAGGGTYVGRR
jgi:hypothetical protein